MKRLIAIASLMLASCISSTNTIGTIEGKKIGVAYSINKVLQLCHAHYGITIFNNFEKRYVVSQDIVKLAVAGYVAGIEETGNRAVVVPDPPDFSDLMSIAAWDGKPSLTPQGKEAVIRIGAKYDVDFVMVARGFERDIDPSVCLGINLITRGPNVKNFIPTYIAFVLDAKNGKYVGNTQISNAEFWSEVAPPANARELSPREIAAYTNYTEVAAKKAIKKFISGGWSHL